MRFNLSSPQSLDHADKNNGKERANSKNGRISLQADERFALFFSKRSARPAQPLAERAALDRGHSQANHAASAAEARQRSASKRTTAERTAPRHAEAAPARNEATTRGRESAASKRSREPAPERNSAPVEQATQEDSNATAAQAATASQDGNSADSNDSAEAAASTATATTTSAQENTATPNTAAANGEALAQTTRGAGEADAGIAQEQVQQDSVEAENIAALTALVAGMASSQPVLDPAVAMVVEDGLALTLDGEGGKPAKTIVAQWLSMQAGAAKGKAENSATVDVDSQGAGDDLLASGGEGKEGKNNPALLKGAVRANALAAAQDKPIVIAPEARNATSNNFMAAFSNAVAAKSGAGGQGGPGGEGGNNTLSPQLLHANGAGAGNSPQGRTNNTASLPQLPVYTPAGQRAWAEDVAVRLNWMANRGQGKAELVLTPPSLGRLGVSLQMNGDQISAHFVAATAAARDLLEQALPRLREILQQSNIHLGQSDVSTGEQSFFQQQNGADASHERHASSMRGLPGTTDADDDVNIASASVTTHRLDGRVDVFA